MCSKTIFSWNDNFSKVNLLFENLIDTNLLKTLKANPPTEFPAVNLTWLGEFTNLGTTNEEIKKNLKQHFSQIFSNIRLYHACGPKSVNSYYIKGFMPLDSKEIEDDFKVTFSSHTSEKNIQNAIQEANIFITTMTKAIKERINVYYSLDKNCADEESDGLMFGGEYLRILVNKLHGIDDIKKQKILFHGRTPTVFVVDIPLHMIDENSLSWILGHIACKWVCVTLRNEDYNSLDGGINFFQLDPQYIYEHYHLEKIVNRHSGTGSIRTLEIYCDKCHASKLISIVSNL